MRYVWLFLCLCTTHLLTAQNEAEHKVQNLLDTGYSLEQSQPDSAIIFYKKAARLSALRNDTINLGRSYHYQGIVFSDQVRYDSAKYYYLLAIEQYELANYLKGVGAVFNNFANIALRTNEYKAALNHYQRALPKFQVAKDKLSIGICENNMSSVFFQLEVYEKAIEHAENALKIGIAIPDSILMMDAYHNLGAYYLAKNDTLNAVKFSTFSSEIASRINNVYGLYNAYSRLSDLHLDKQAEIGLSYAIKAKEQAEILNAPILMLNAEALLGLAHFNLEHYDQAIFRLKKVLASKEQVKSNFDRGRYISFLSQAYAAKGNYIAAYDYLQQYSEIKQTITDAEKRKAILEVETKYQVKEQETALQNQTLLVAQERQSRLAWAVVASLLGVILLFVIFWYRQQLSKNQLLATKESELQKTRIEQLEQAQKVLTLNAMINGQEEERKRIAKDLHDSLGSLLSTVKLNFRAIQQKIEQLEQMNLYQRVDDLLDNASEEVRRISHDMMPDVLKISLSEGIKEIVQNYNQTRQLEVHFQEFGSAISLDDSQKIMLYRIVQELTQNAVKHAEATTLLIQLLWGNNQLQIVVEDNGKGFDPNATHEGLGLRSVQSRVSYLNGTLDFDSEIGVGTTLNIILNIL